MLSHMKVAAIGISNIYIGALCVITIASIYDADGTQRSIIEYIQWIGISSTGVEDLSESWKDGGRVLLRNDDVQIKQWPPSASAAYMLYICYILYYIYYGALCAINIICRCGGSSG